MSASSRHRPARPPTAPGRAVRRVGSIAHVELLDSITTLRPDLAGSVVVSGSHGGRYAAAVASQVPLRGVVFHDAAVGLDDAGIAGLSLLAEVGLPAVAISSTSARIGDADDTLARGVVSFVNAPARRAGCNEGMDCGPAASVLLAGEIVDSPLRLLEEPAVCLVDEPPRVWLLDSASLVGPEHAHAVVVTGSHGALLGGRAPAALKAEAAAALFNDAGGGAGTTRLAALDTRDIAAATVAALSARIGDSRSTYESGVVSRINRTAERQGCRIGISARAFVEMVRAAAVRRRR